MLQPGEILNGYRLIRPIGAGGFGEVWLCQSVPLGELRALKFIHATNAGQLQKEFAAVCRFQSAAEQLQSPAIISVQPPILHAAGMAYVMPLADGFGAGEASDPQWRPLTLSARLELRRAEPLWFPSEDLCGWLITILDALQLLSNAGLVHRDVKPDNILFFNGTPCLADMGLLGADSAQLTRRGTPGYLAPSWFLESAGHPDMYGVATTFYTMLTGNSPDKMGRAAYRWPPQGEATLSPEERIEWLRLHRIIRRAVDDRPAERFIDFSAFARSLKQSGEDPPQDYDAAEPLVGAPMHHLPMDLVQNTVRRKRLTRRAALLSLPLLALGGYAVHKKVQSEEVTKDAQSAASGLGSEIPWISVSMVLASLTNCGFKQIVNEPGLMLFSKTMTAEDIPQGVSVALHYDPASNAVWTYRCLSISNNETLKFNNKAFREGIASICAIFVSDKEWDEIREFIYRPKNAMKEVQFKSETMLFRDAHLSADCELFFESNDSSTLQHAFAVSSRA